ncbi:hypothetical protein ACTJKQ_14140 [Acidovorax sp. 22279]|uniref:hypothetical protein n=1 Tax=Acidovorax sp. 22279 TaxID=3453900 RepID=UPI003F83F0F4
MTEPTDTVDLIGVRANGEHVNLGRVTMPPRMKAREIARSYFGHFDDEDGSDAELCFGALETFLDWLVKHGWHDTPQPTQAQAGAVPLTDERLVACIKAAGFKTWDSRMWALKREIEAAHGIKGDQHGAE